MKYKFHFLMVLFLSAVFSSCTQDGYETGEGAYSQLRADLVDVHVNGDRRVDYVLTDDGDSLRTQRPFTVGWIEVADTTYRALLYYNLKEGNVEGYSMGQVLVPNIKPVGSFKGGMKTDAVHMTSIWRGQNGRYLNMRLRVMTGADEGTESHKQAFGCGSDTLITHADGHRTLYLRLYHDQGGQPEYYSRDVYLSIPISHVEADTLVMSIKTYDGLVVKKLTNKPSENK